MRLRNYKETVPYTIEDTLRDVHPHTLEEPFHWAASVGEPVLVLAGDENGLNRKWRKGYVIYEASQILTDWGIFYSYCVKYTVKRKEVASLFTPGLQMEMKPDTPEVRELLREAGVIM